MTGVLHTGLERETKNIILNMPGQNLSRHPVKIVKAVSNGEKALSIAESAQPDVILLDIMMPGMDGYEVCRRLKQMEATREIPVIFVTALTEVTDEEKGFEVGGILVISDFFVV